MPRYRIETEGRAREVYEVETDRPMSTSEDALFAIEGERARITEVSDVEIVNFEVAD